MDDEDILMDRINNKENIERMDKLIYLLGKLDFVPDFMKLYDSIMGIVPLSREEEKVLANRIISLIGGEDE